VQELGRAMVERRAKEAPIRRGHAIYACSRLKIDLIGQAALPT